MKIGSYKAEIQELIALIRGKDNHPIQWEEASAHVVSIRNVDPAEIVKAINMQNKLGFDLVSRKFYVKPTYPQIYDSQTFIQHLTTTNCGLFEDDELFDSYRGIKNDIKVIEIANAEKKKNVLFCCEELPEYENILSNLSDETFRFLSEKWREIHHVKSEEMSNELQSKQPHISLPPPISLKKKDIRKINRKGEQKLHRTKE